MNLFEHINTRIKNLTITDIQFIKISAMAFILLIAKLWEPLLGLEWYWYLILCIITGIKPLTKMFK